MEDETQCLLRGRLFERQTDPIASPTHMYMPVLSNIFCNTQPFILCPGNLKMKISVVTLILSCAFPLVNGQQNHVPLGRNLRSGSGAPDTVRKVQEGDTCEDMDIVTRLGTPDCLPPSLENVCDQYEDKKASGICVAFCEAKDCDAAEYDDIKSCMKLKENFVRITGETSLPCEARCPCWDSLTQLVGSQTVYFSSVWVAAFEGAVTAQGDSFFAYADATKCSLSGSFLKLSDPAVAEMCQRDIYSLILDKYQEDTTSNVPPPCQPIPVVDTTATCPCWDDELEHHPDSANIKYFRRFVFSEGDVFSVVDDEGNSWECQADTTADQDSACKNDLLDAASDQGLVPLCFEYVAP